MKAKNLIIIGIILPGLISCIEDTVQLDELSTQIEIERSIAIPILKTSLSLEQVGADGYDSFDFLDTGDTIYYYNIEEVSLHDTSEFRGIENNSIELEFDYVNIYHSIINMLPVNLKFNLFLYNEELGTNVDTISFSQPGKEYFIVAPTAYEPNGLIIEDQLEVQTGKVSLDADLMDKLLNNTTHIVIDARIAEHDTLVKILGHYGIDLQLGLEAKGRFIAELDSLLNQPTEEL
jgi:hypothetical protein